MRKGYADQLKLLRAQVRVPPDPNRLTEPAKVGILNVGIAFVLLPLFLFNAGIALSAAVLVLMAAIVIGFLVRPGVQPKARRFLGGELLVGAVVYTIAGAAIVFSALTIREPAIPRGLPSEVFQLPPLDMDLWGANFAGGLIPYHGYPITLSATFVEDDVDAQLRNDPSLRKPILKSLLGRWYGENAYLTVAARRTAGTPGERDHDWNDKLTASEERTFRPSMRAPLQLAPSDLHQSLDLVMGMDVCYPYRSSNSTFSNARTPVSKTARLFVVTPAEFELRKELDKWDTRGDLRDRGFFFVAVAVLAAASGLLLLWRGRKPKNASSGDARTALPQ